MKKLYKRIRLEYYLMLISRRYKKLGAFDKIVVVMLIDNIQVKSMEVEAMKMFINSTYGVNDLYKPLYSETTNITKHRIEMKEEVNKLITRLIELIPEFGYFI